MKAAAENGMELIMTAACDMPFVKAELFSYLYEQMGSYEGAVARSGGKVHPLAAIYSVKAVEVFGKQLESGDYRLLDALNKLKIDKRGLDSIDNKILRTLITKFKGGPVGVGTLATAISEDTGTLEEVYEPFLIKEGFIMRTQRGRIATEMAYQHLGLVSYYTPKQTDEENGTLF